MLSCPSPNIRLRFALPAAGLLILASCARSAEVAPPEPDRNLEPAAAAPASRCSPHESVDPTDALALLESAVGELVRVTDTPGAVVEADCGVSRRPLCAALFLIGATDPIIGFARGADSTDLARLVVLHELVLDRAVHLARTTDRDQLEAALARLAALDVAAAIEGGDDAIAELVVTRAAPEVVAPISAVEANC